MTQPRFRRRRGQLLAGAVPLLVAVRALAGGHSASAASVGCKVDYAVTASWSGGFGANVTLTNLGDPVDGWTVGWNFPAGQTITQLWNGTYTQSGSQVTVTNMSYNGNLGQGG